MHKRACFWKPFGSERVNKQSCSILHQLRNVRFSENVFWFVSYTLYFYKIFLFPVFNIIALVEYEILSAEL